MRKSYVQIDGVLHEKTPELMRPRSGFPYVYGDLPDFVSPIDGRVVHGRAGMREHCKVHNVVPTSDLKGLPARLPQTVGSTAERRADIIRAVNQHVR